MLLVVRNHQLERIRDPKKHLGRMHLWVLFTDMFKSSEENGLSREVILQVTSRLVMALISSQRGSSNGVAYMDLVKWGYIKFFFLLPNLYCSFMCLLDNYSFLKLATLELYVRNILSGPFI